MDLKIGYILSAGRYRIEKVLGTGGFGITYLAEQVSLGRKVAIKEFFMKEHCNRDTDTSYVSVPSIGSRELVDRFRQKFLKEARSLAALNHKHIVRIIDVFEENGTAYYVMEHVGGGSLGDKVKSGAIPESDAVRYIRQVASALDFVHSKHIMHLDVKPANILLNDDDEAVLIDFGLAKQYDDAGTQTSTTPVGISHGYAPMEQYKRGGVGTFSPATDIYSLGATLYKLVTGLTPPEANDVADEGLPALPQHLSANVRAAIEAAMQFRRKDRPQSIGEFLEIVESGKMKDDSDGIDDCPPALRGTSAAEGVNDSSATDDGETVVGNPSGSCHPERSEPSVDARRGQSQGSYKKANKEILHSVQNDKHANPVILSASEESYKHANREILHSVQNDKGGKMRDESGEVKDERKGLGGTSKKKWAIIIAVLVIGAVAALFGTMSGGSSDDTAAERDNSAEIVANSGTDVIPAAAVEIQIPQKNDNSFSTRTFTVNGVSFKMVAVDGGTFTMGATSEQQSPDSDEKPIHNVTLSDYYIGETEVTQALWQAVMGNNPSYFSGSNNPVEEVSYDDCITFINKLNSQLSGQLPSGRKFRLPTEAEWEFAARGGNRSRGNQYSGSNSLGSVAWYWDNSNSQTHPVKQKQANELGLYDMSGNVWEWCYDWYGNYSSSSQTNPKGPSSGSYRVLRGGCWCRFAQFCRVAIRYNSTPDGRDGNYGLRLAL